MKKFLLFFIFFLSLFAMNSCHPVKTGLLTSPIYKNPLEIKHWINWNLLFTPTATGTTASVVQSFENYLTAYVNAINPTVTLTFQVSHCPCDPQLTNIDATLVSGSGYTVPAPPTKPNPKPSGDYILSNNLTMVIPDFNDTANHIDLANLYTDTTVFAPSPGSASQLLAFIDTGLDTLTFKLAFPKTIWGGNLLWTSPVIPGATVTPTIFDVLPGESTSALMDDNKVKHGTAATGIALSQIHQLNPSGVPRIMSIRAFDGSESGSIYTTGCAMNCAIENKANYINASWGYYGEEDSVLKYYVSKASNHSIRVIAAAGNTPGSHDPNLVCGGIVNPQNNLGRLKGTDSLFYPACFAPEMTNLVSVTQLNANPLMASQILPCYYQNYSPDFITVGALENPASTVPCCSFRVPFLKSNIEGSSFATPVITAVLMAGSADSQLPVKDFIRVKAKHLLPPFFTDSGSYFDFSITR